MMLLLALKKILQEYPNYRIKAIFVGNGPDLQPLRYFVISAQLDKMVFFLGHRNNIPQILSLIDVLVSTTISEQEGLSNVILEAMASSVAILSTKSIGTNELVSHGVNGFLINNNDIHDLVNKIVLLYNNEQLKVLMGEQGRHIVCKHYSLEKMVEGYETVYLRSLKRKGIWDIT